MMKVVCFIKGSRQEWRGGLLMERMSVLGWVDRD